MGTVFLAKSIVDLSFGGAFAVYAVKYIISGLVAFGGICLGIWLRKRKIAKSEEAAKETK